VSLYAAFSDLFAASQINEAHFVLILFLLASISPIYEENSVRPRRAVVVISASYLAVSVAETNQVHDFVMVFHSHFHQTLEYY
jgi:hypothetical protein